MAFPLWTRRASLQAWRKRHLLSRGLELLILDSKLSNKMLLGINRGAQKSAHDAKELDLSSAIALVGATVTSLGVEHAEAADEWPATHAEVVAWQFPSQQSCTLRTRRIILAKQSIKESTYSSMFSIILCTLTNN